MSYSGARLSPFFSQEPIRRACRKMAEEGGRAMGRLTRANTPIGWQKFPGLNSAPGALRESIRDKVLVIYPGPDGMVYETGCETNLEYAAYVEYGTGIHHIGEDGTPEPHTPWIIRPKNPDGWLRWIDQNTGQPVFAKQVVQTGIRPQAMFAIGAHLSEYEFETLIAPKVLAEWQAEHESMFERQPPVFIGVRV